jgi:Na+/H+ antiporter NhaC
MEIDRRLVAELAVSATAVVVFVGAAVLVTGEYAAPTNSSSNATAPSLQPDGGLAMVGVVVLFVVVMGAAGLVMYSLDFDDEDE